LTNVIDLGSPVQAR